MVPSSIPEGIPVLSRGKHRSARRGACFMEMASVLAGEQWSDHPTCTHPLLAQLARTVNDYTSDAGRGRLAQHIPSVVGLRGGGLSWEVSLTAAVAAEVILDVPERFQRMLAVGLLRCEELAASIGPDAVEGFDDIRQALADVPHATAWARRFIDGMPLTPEQFRQRSAPHLMTCAVRGIAETGAPDTDERLHHLLAAAIETGLRLQPPAPTAGGGPHLAAERRSRDGRFAGPVWR
jgi:hypothetical protein